MAMDIQTRGIRFQTTTLNGLTETVIPKIVAEITNLVTILTFSPMTLLNVKTQMVMDMAIMPQEITAMRSSLTQHNGLILMVMDSAIITALVQ